MSSFAKSNKAAQRIHKERHQLESRRHLGALEKKKDYRIRAKDTNEKKAQIKRLRQKALEKNPDEFYFHMKNAKLVGGVHHDKVKGEEFTEEQLKLMQVQDFRYIQMKRVIETQKIEKLKSNLHCIGLTEEVSNKHIFFDSDGKKLKKVDLAERLDTTEELVGRRYNRMRVEDLQEEISVKNEVLREAAKEAKKTYRELESRIKKEQQLRVLEEKVQMKKLLLDKKHPPKAKVVEGTKSQAPVYVWTKERKR